MCSNPAWNRGKRRIELARIAATRLCKVRPATAFATNCIAADQYISLVIPGRMFSEQYQQHQLAPEHLSRALEDGGTVTSALVPWNTCGAYMHGVLQVDPLHYAIYCFYNWLTPLVAILLLQLGVIRLPVMGEQSAAAIKLR